MDLDDCAMDDEKSKTWLQSVAVVAPREESLKQYATPSESNFGFAEQIGFGIKGISVAKETWGEKSSKHSVTSVIAGNEMEISGYLDEIDEPLLRSPKKRLILPGSSSRRKCSILSTPGSISFGKCAKKRSNGKKITMLRYAGVTPMVVKREPKIVRSPEIYKIKCEQEIAVDNGVEADKKTAKGTEIRKRGEKFEADEEYNNVIEKLSQLNPYGDDEQRAGEESYYHAGIKKVVVKEEDRKNLISKFAELEL